MKSASSAVRLFASVSFVLTATLFPAAGAIVFQADFNGAGGATGESANIATFGGTGSLVNVSGSNVASSIASATPLFPGELGYLHISDTGSGSAGGYGVKFVPASAAHSPDCWYSTNGTYVLINGGLDFFFRDSQPSSSWSGGTEFRPIDIGGANGGIRLVINDFTKDRLQAELSAKSSAGSSLFDIRACPAANVMSIDAGTLYHVAVTVATDPTTGYITLKIFLAQGNVAIDTSTNAYLLASATTTQGFSPSVITSALNTAGGFAFGQYNNGADTKTLDLGAFRVHDQPGVVMPKVSFLPDLPNVATPVPEPSLPSGFDLFSPPVAPSGTPAAGTPTGAEWTRTGNPGDGLVVAGDALTSFSGTDAGKDSAFLCYGQSSSAIQAAPAAFYRQQGNGAAIQLAPSLPASSMYLVWPRNSNGYGAPIAVNKTEAWWIGPDKAAPGQAVSLYGRNLTSNLSGTGTGTVGIYIKPQGTASGYWLAATAANPYKVDFVVTNSLTAGTYEVWAHNGHGEHYGWSGPVLLAVTNGVTWTTNMFNVKSYGATGNGVTNDATAIQNALNAATPYSTVYFPSGTYVVGQGLKAPYNVRWLGVTNAGSLASTLVMATNNTMLVNIPGGTANVALSNLQLNSGTSTNSYLIEHYNWGTGTSVSSLQISNCTLAATNSSSQGTLYFSPCDHLSIQGTTVNGNGLVLIDSSQVSIDGCTFNGMWDSALLNVKGHSSQMSFTNNTGQDYDNYLGYTYNPSTSSYTGDTAGTGWSQGVFFKGLNNDGARGNLYFSGNTGRNMGVRLTGDNNWGEQVSFEQNYGQYAGAVSSATPTSVAFASGALATLNTTGPLIAAIVNGKGRGQWRDVGSVNVAAASVTLASGQSWNVTPDATSTVALGWYVENAVSYRNTFTGKSDRVGATGQWGITGVLSYGGVMNLVADSDTYNYAKYGLHPVSMIPRDATAQYASPCYFHLYLNNTMHDCQQDLGDDLSANTSGYLNSLAMTSGLGHVFRGNKANDTAAGTSVNGIAMISQPNGAAGALDMILFEQNSISDAPQGVNLVGSGSMGTEGNILFASNAFALGSSVSGSYGVSLPSGPLVGFRDNTYSGFSTTYAGTPPGALLELPVRVLDASADLLGDTDTPALAVRNDGTSTLSWSVSTDVTWLTVSPTADTIASEGRKGYTVSCDPTGLTGAGTGTDTVYVGTVTFTTTTGTPQTRKATVNFHIMQ